MWNHRVVRHYYPSAAVSSERRMLELQEVYYNRDGKPRGHGAPFLNGSTRAELRTTLDRMRIALSKPVMRCLCCKHPTPATKRRKK